MWFLLLFGRGSGFKSRRVHMPARYVREDTFELTVDREFVLYIDCDGENRIEFTPDGSLSFDGDDASFERLYRLLDERRDLRISDSTHCIRVDGYGTDAEQAICMAKIQRIADWLGITRPYVM